MIDLHCHILPGLDDGADSLARSLDMARIAVADGITAMACTPHIRPAGHNNAAGTIAAATRLFADELARAGVPLSVVTGADIHLVPDLQAGLRSGRYPTLGGSRHFLLELPHYVRPPYLRKTLHEVMAGGHVPIITHPERQPWIETGHATLATLSDRGVWMQVTAGSLTGGFGRRARYWAERLLEEGRVQLLASDAHDTDRRPPLLSRARDLAADRVGEAEAERLVTTRAAQILADRGRPGKIDERETGAAMEGERC